MSVRWLGRLDEVPAGQWNALSDGNPFVGHAFLHAMQESGSAVPENGWQASHLIVEQNGRLQAASPGWIKHHSHGEFVFDWHWADFHHRNGVPYYPKLLVGSPYSPITGPRLLAHCDQQAATLIQAHIERAREKQLSGVHWNFLTDTDQRRLDEAIPGLIPRLQWQFHWFNEGYESFEHFLSRLKRKRRKNINQERRKLRGLRFVRIPGREASEDHWHFAWRMYRRTFLEKGNHPAITQAFFLSTRNSLDFLLILALEQERPVACAIFLRGKNTLYGRYWGSTIRQPGLHFETCYYQAIEYCIEQGIARFEPGAQGEHKLARGFLPVPCWSRHWLAHAELADAVRKHTQNETEMMISYGQELAEHQPFQEPVVHDPLAFR